MEIENRLLRLGYYLKVWQILGDLVAVAYEDCYVRDGPCLVGIFGEGKNFKEACEDYCRRISGKELVFGEGTKNRKTVRVLI